jgi:hypothetical protein
MKSIYQTKTITFTIIAINIIAFFIVSYTGLLIGDLTGFNTNVKYIGLSIFLFLVSLYFINSLFNVLDKTKPLFKINNAYYFGYILLFLQVLFIIYVATTGFFVAGSSEKSGSIISAFFVIVNIDALMMLYLAHRKDDVLRRTNTIVWIVSFIQRGWISYLLYIFIAWFIKRKVEKKNVKYLAFLLIPLFLLSPYIDGLKNSIRTGIEQSINDDYITSLGGQIFKVTSRLQTVSHIDYVLGHKDEMDTKYNGIQLTPFYLENIASVIYDKITPGNISYISSDFLAHLISPNLEGSWNVNPSLIGWVIMHGDYYILQILWIIFLCLCFMQLSKSVSKGLYTKNMRWVLWLLFLLPGWIFQFTTVIYTLVIYIGLNYLTFIINKRSV